jgi:hypothetical protein
MRGRPVTIPGAVSLAEDYQSSASPTRESSSGMDILMEPMSIPGSMPVRLKKWVIAYGDSMITG